MAKRKMSETDEREELLSFIMSALGLVLMSKGAKIDVALHRECAVNVLDTLEDEGFKVVKDATRS